MTATHERIEIISIELCMCRESIECFSLCESPKKIGVVNDVTHQSEHQQCQGETRIHG
jgi:hypothetical protein